MAKRTHESANLSTFDKTSLDVLLREQYQVCFFQRPERLYNMVFRRPFESTIAVQCGALQASEYTLWCFEYGYKNLEQKPYLIIVMIQHRSDPVYHYIYLLFKRSTCGNKIFGYMIR